MKREQMVPCCVCEGLGLYPVECYGADYDNGERYFRAKPDATACGTCEGTGKVLAVVSDEPDKRDEEWDRREEAMARAEFERDVSMFR